MATQNITYAFRVTGGGDYKKKNNKPSVDFEWESIANPVRNFPALFARGNTAEGDGRHAIVAISQETRCVAGVRT